MADPTGAGAVFAAINTAFRFSEFVIALSEVGEENHVFVRTIQRVRLDLEETERLLAVPAIKGALDSNPQKLIWIRGAIFSTKHALNDIGLYVERVRADKDRDGSITFAHRVRWVLQDHGKLENRRSELAACHQTLTTVLNSLHQIETMANLGPVPLVDFVPPPTYEAALLDGDLFGPYTRKKKKPRAVETEIKDEKPRQDVEIPRPTQQEPKPSESMAQETKPTPVETNPNKVLPFPVPNEALHQQEAATTPVVAPQVPPKNEVAQITDSVASIHLTEPADSSFDSHNMFGPVDPFKFYELDEKTTPSPKPDHRFSIASTIIPEELDATEEALPKPPPPSQASHRFSVASSIAEELDSTERTSSRPRPQGCNSHRLSQSSETSPLSTFYSSDYEFFAYPQQTGIEDYPDLSHSSSSATLSSLHQSETQNYQPSLHHSSSSATIFSLNQYETQNYNPGLHHSASSATFVSQMTIPSRTGTPLDPVAEMENCQIAAELPAQTSSFQRPHSFSVPLVELPVQEPSRKYNSVHYPSSASEMSGDSAPYRRRQTQPVVPPRPMRQNQIHPMPPAFTYQTPITMTETEPGYHPYNPQSQPPTKYGAYNPSHPNPQPQNQPPQPTTQYSPYQPAPPPTVPAKPTYLSQSTQPQTQYTSYQPSTPSPKPSTPIPQTQHQNNLPPFRNPILHLPPHLATVNPPRRPPLTYSISTQPQPQNTLPYPMDPSTRSQTVPMPRPSVYLAPSPQQMDRDRNMNVSPIPRGTGPGPRAGVSQSVRRRKAMEVALGVHR